MSTKTMWLAYLAVVLGLVWLWWSRGHRLSVPDVSRRERLNYLLAKESHRASPELPLLPGAELARNRASTLSGMVFVLAGSTYWALPLVTAMLQDPWKADNYRTLCDGLLGGTALLLCPILCAGVVVQLSTEVTAEGIRRPSWAGGSFIPWSAVTEVSIADSKGGVGLEVRAGRQRILLPTYQFHSPADLVALIRRSVPLERLKDI